MNDIKKWLRCLRTCISGDVRRADEMTCSTCRYQGWVDDARRVGLVLLGQGIKKGYMRYRFSECGHERELYREAVKNNAFICNQCNVTAWDSPATVYLFRMEYDGFEWLKLGYSKNPMERRKKYGLPNETNFELLFERRFSDGHQVFEFEQLKLTELAEFRIPAVDMVRYHASGARECLKIEAMESVLESLSRAG
ncbi:hypothetical protein N9L12_04140 [Luminiphilus sp.]|nr:hypothetical protein [Luminiphilus sp.]